MPKFSNVLDKVSNLCKRRGFFLQRCLSPSEKVRDGNANIFDYGPLGVEIKRNLVSEWWQEIVTSRDNIHGLDLSMMHLVQNNTPQSGTKAIGAVDKSEASHHGDHIYAHAFTYLKTFGFEIPFGLAQNFRILTSGNNDVDQFIFRSPQKEFLKLCFFCSPNKLNEWMDYWMRKRLSWWKKYADMPAGFSLTESEHGQLFCQENTSSLSDTMAVEFEFPWGKEAVESISSYSNLQHVGGEDAANTAEAKQLGVVMATSSVEKGILAYLLDSFHEKERANTEGVMVRHNTLRLHPVLAPIKVAVLSTNQLSNDLCRVAQQLATELRQAGMASSYVEYGEDHGDCYSREDEVGTPYCVTVQDTTLTNGIVTLRNRDTTLSEFLHISEVLKTVQRHLDSL